LSSGLVKHHRVLERGAKREARTPHRALSFMQPNVRPGKLATEPFRAEIKRVFLAADHRIGEVDLDLGAEARRIGAHSP